MTGIVTPQQIKTIFLITFILLLGLFISPLNYGYAEDYYVPSSSGDSNDNDGSGWWSNDSGGQPSNPGNNDSDDSDGSTDVTNPDGNGSCPPGCYLLLGKCICRNGSGDDDTGGNCPDGCVLMLGQCICRNDNDQDGNDQSEGWWNDIDDDGDGFSENQGDCDDNDFAIYPSAEEFCGDGKDNDQDGVVDEDCPTCTDADGDGYFAETGCGTAVDCNDHDPNIHPNYGIPDCGDGVDNDCDGLIDEDCSDDGDAGNDLNLPPEQPLALSPNANMITSLTPELTTYEFLDLDGDTHAKTRWQIGTLPSFTGIGLLLEEISDTQLTSWQVPSECILKNDTQYFWRAMYFDGQDWSVFSNINGFRTGSAGIEFNENGIGKASVIDPGDPVKLPEALFTDDDGNLITSQTVKAIRSVTDPEVQIGMIAEGGCTIEKICSRRPEDIVAKGNSFDDEIPEMPYGMIDFALSLPEKGAVADVTIYFSEPLPEDFRWWKYDPTIGFYDFVNSVLPATVLMVSSDRKTVALQLKDGGYGDLIEAPDGKIFDPSGAGLSLDSTSSSSSGDGGSCFIRLLSF